jgi:hypothetical protein
MKTLIEYIAEAKLDYSKRIKLGDVDKVPKRYWTNYSDDDIECYYSEYINKVFGFYNQWIEKNFKKMINQAESGIAKLPDSIPIELPDGLFGDLIFEWDAGWLDGEKLTGKLNNVEIEVAHVSPPSLRADENPRTFYDYKQDFEKFKLVHAPIKI